jgi:hypothetical protein
MTRHPQMAQTTAVKTSLVAIAIYSCPTRQRRGALLGGREFRMWHAWWRPPTACCETCGMLGFRLSQLTRLCIGFRCVCVWLYKHGCKIERDDEQAQQVAAGSTGSRQQAVGGRQPSRLAFTCSSVATEGGREGGR